MRTFIRIADDNDFYTAVRDNTFIISKYKPKPYKEYRELTESEYSSYRAYDHLCILLLNTEMRNELREKSKINDICRHFPDLAKKHKLTIDDKHEYWRK